MSTHETRRVDVVVWGGGCGGSAAALQAARSGATTLLLTPGPWLGGMLSAAGVCAPDGNELSPWQSGIWGALLRELARLEPQGLDHNWVSCFGFRPASAEAILRRWLAEAPGLEWLPGCRLEAVERRGDRIELLEVTLPGRRLRIHPRQVIDGSDRGELLARAAVRYRFGWESQQTWHEPSAPAQQRLETDPFFVQQPVQSPTWVVMGQLTAGHPQPGPTAPEPGGAFLGCCQRFGLERTITYGRLPGGLVMLNWPLQGNDWHQGLDRAFSDDAGQQQQLAAAMRAHSLAFASALRDCSGGWLELGRVFPSADAALRGDLEGEEPLALMPYWREGRRLIGLDLVLEQHLLPLAKGACRAALPTNAQGEVSAIAVGNYVNDHHYPGPDWPLAAKSCRWGGRWSGTPFTLPFGALVSAEVSNLLVAEKGISVSHIANGATRLQPLVLNLGQAAGLAAALCCRSGLAPAELPVRQLQDSLLDDPLAPAGPLPLWDTPWHDPSWRDRQRRALDDPARLDRHGRLERLAAESPLDPGNAPAEPGEALWQGELVPDGEGGYLLQRDGADWPLITLEPAMHDWLLRQERPCSVALIGACNPWGPWLRVSRIAG